MRVTSSATLPIQVRLQEKRGGDAIDRGASPFSANAAGDHRSLGLGRRHPFVDQLDRQARRDAKRRGERLGRFCLGPERPIHAARQADDDVRGVVIPGRGNQARHKRLPRLRVDGAERLRDRPGRVAQGEADTPRPGVDREHPAYGLCAGEGEGEAEPCDAAEADGAFDSTT